MREIIISTVLLPIDTNKHTGTKVQEISPNLLHKINYYSAHWDRTSKKFPRPF